MTLLDPRDLRILLLALLLEAVFGYPGWVYAAIRHPVVWIGALIGALERALNRDDLTEGARRALGAASLALVLAITGGVAAVIAWALRRVPLGWVIEAVLATSLLAPRSLFEHVAAVARALERSGLVAARRAVTEIVGRDPDSLDEAGVCRAAIESLAENFSDGVVAPALWFALAGLPGMVAYKAINTADSMIGHLDRRHSAFGWAAARLDDLVNLPASRLAALLLVLAALFAPHAHASAAARAAWRDARRHRSPNAGWPEAAMAGALRLSLAGPRVYGGERVGDAWMGAGRAEVESADIRAALSLYRLACAALWLSLAAAVGIVSL